MPINDLNGNVIISEIENKQIVVFIEQNKIYSNVISKEKCDFGTPTALASGSGDAKSESFFCHLSSKNDKNEDVIFEIGFIKDKATNKYSVVKLNKLPHVK